MAKNGLVLLCINVICVVLGSSKTDLYLQVHFSEEYTLYNNPVAIDMALKAVNKNSSVLPDYTLKRIPTVIDSKCKETPSVHGFIEHLNSKNFTEIMIIGSDCSASSIAVADLSQKWNFVQISPSSTSPQLSDSKAYKYFLRTVPSDSVMATSIIKLMHHFRWKYLSILTEGQDLFLKMLDIMKEDVIKAGLFIGESVTFTNNSPSAVEELNEKNARVIFLNTYENHAIEILCKAYKLGMIYPKCAWITYGWYRDSFWNIVQNSSCTFNATFCTREEFLEAVNQMIVVHTYPKADSNDTLIIGNMTKGNYLERFVTEYKRRGGTKRICQSQIPVEETTFAYDAIWLAALALSKTESPALHLESFRHDESYSKAIYENALQIKFQGASGLVQLTEYGDRMPEIRFYQYHLQSQVYTDKQEAVRKQFAYLSTSGDYHPYPGAPEPFNGQVPKTDEVVRIHLSLFASFTVLSIAGVIFACVCLVFNLVNRKKESIKLTSPYLNVVFITGCIIVYGIVILYGMDHARVGMAGMSLVCPILLWLGVVAFSLIYGSIMAKAFRVYYIFRNLRFGQSVKMKWSIKEWHTFGVMGLLLLVDFLFLMIVTGIPETRLKLNSTLDKSGDIPRETFTCYSSYESVWLSILGIYKAIEVIISLVFAFEVRKIRVKELNDSNMIIFSVYAFIVSVLALIPLLFTLNTYPNALYGIGGTVLLLSATVLLGINFLPKMHSLYKNPSGKVKLDFSNIARSQVTSSMRKKEKPVIKPRKVDPVKQSGIPTNTSGSSALTPQTPPTINSASVFFDQTPPEANNPYVVMISTV